ncbi:MAG: glycosyltransferase family 4 protein [Pirellulaceae bacterium]
MLKSDASSRTTVLMIGDFPPPVTGAAKNNQIVADLMEDKFHVIRLNTSSTSSALNRSLGYHAIRIVRNARAALGIAWSCITSRQRCTVYHVPNAGYGSIYTVAFVFISYLLRVRCVLHHRSFRYIDRPTRSMRWVQRMMRSTGLHVFLSDGMKQAFAAAYGGDVESLVVSNAAYIDVTMGHQRQPNGKLVLGHLSNLCREKGIFDVIETFRHLRAFRQDVRLHIGGPAMNRDVESELTKLQQEFGEAVTVAGRIQPEEKNRFYEQIDLFLFPTRYAVEAQPNVVFEALASGCPVAAFDRGCIREMIGCESLLVAADAEYAQDVATWIDQISNSHQLSERSSQALSHCALQQAAGKAQLQQVLERF